MLELHLLGEFRVCRNGRRVDPEALGRPLNRQILQILADRAGETVHAEQIVEQLWPEGDPDKALTNLRARVSELRRALEPDLARGTDSRYIRSVPGGYRLDPDWVWVDAQSFQARIDRAIDAQAHGKPTEAADDYERALALWRGDYLADARYAEWVEPLRADWTARCVEATKRLADCRLHLGDPEGAIVALERALVVAPYDEGLWARLVSAYRDAGSRAEAARALDRAERTLREDLGVAPSSELRALSDDLRRSDEDASTVHADSSSIPTAPSTRAPEPKSSTNGADHGAASRATSAGIDADESDGHKRARAVLLGSEVLPDSLPRVAKAVFVVVVALLTAAPATGWLIAERAPNTSLSASSSTVESPTVTTIEAGEDLRTALRTASPGDVIRVGPGRHPGPYRIETPLTLRGVDRPVLEGNGAPGAVVQIVADDVVMEGFRIRNLSGRDLDQYGIVVGDGGTPVSGVQLIDNAVGPLRGSTGDDPPKGPTRTRGIVIQGGARSVAIRDNIVRGVRGPQASSAAGIAVLSEAGPLTLRGNTLEDNDVGLHLLRTPEALTVTGNNLARNGVGLRNDSGTSVDARGNWWGCTQGPDAAVCNGVEGPVCVEPWRGSHVSGTR